MYSMLSPLRILKRTSLLYLVFFIMFLLLKHSCFPAWYDALLQLLMLLLTLGVAKYVLVQSSNICFYSSIFLFHVFFALLSQYVNYSVYNDEYGYNPVDAQLYRDIIATYGTNSIAGMLIGLMLEGYLFDDFGYPIITWLVNSISGENFVLILLLVNALVVTSSSCYLYKLSSLFVCDKNAKFVAFLWGTMPFAIYVTSNGLKENFFLFFVLLALWYLYKCVHKITLYNLLLFFLSCGVVFLFRLVLGYALLMAYFIYVLFSIKFVRVNFKFVLILGTLSLLLISKTVSSLIIEQRGHDIDTMSDSVSNKISESGGTTAMFINYMSALTGPFPNFVSNELEKRTYVTRYSFSALLKVVVSFYFIYSFLLILKRKLIVMFPLLVFWGINTVMLVFTFRTLDVRFQWPTFPIVFILSIYAYENLGSCYRIRGFYVLYILAMVGLVLIYNMR